MKKTIKVKNACGEVHTSVCEKNSKPYFISFSQHRKDENNEEQYHSISVNIEEIPKLITYLSQFIR